MKSFKEVPQTDKWHVLRDRFYELTPGYTEHTYSHAEHIQAHFINSSEWAPLRNFFFERLSAAEFHWFFVQGVDALMVGYYVPAVSSLLNGIEASLRVTLSQVTKIDEEPLVELSPYKVLSNALILNCQEAGMPIEWLAFPDEDDFKTKLNSVKPNKVDVEVVRQRNNICHGNIFEYIDRSLGPENSMFTPVSLRRLVFNLLDVCGVWAEKLGEYRREKKLLHYN